MRITDMPEFQDKRKVLTMNGNENIFEVAKAMKKDNCGSVVIIDKSRKILGIFTERDLLFKVVAEGKDVKKLKLKDVMTTDINVAHETDEIAASLRRMSQGRFRHLPIVDDHEKLVGMMSQGDFVAFTWPQLVHRLSQSTAVSFLTNTQLWMLIVSILAYAAIMRYLIS